MQTSKVAGPNPTNDDDDERGRRPRRLRGRTPGWSCALSLRVSFSVSFSASSCFCTVSLAALSGVARVSRLLLPPAAPPLSDNALFLLAGARVFFPVVSRNPVVFRNRLSSRLAVVAPCARPRLPNATGWQYRGWRGEEPGRGSEARQVHFPSSSSHIFSQQRRRVHQTSSPNNAVEVHFQQRRRVHQTYGPSARGVVDDDGQFRPWL